jgi:hypothetical protein
VGEFDAVFYTRTTVEEQRAFRDVVLQTKSPGRGFLADRTAGPIRFSRPEPSPDRQRQLPDAQ